MSKALKENMKNEERRRTGVECNREMMKIAKLRLFDSRVRK